MSKVRLLLHFAMGIFYFNLDVQFRKRTVFHFVASVKLCVSWAPVIVILFLLVC